MRGRVIAHGGFANCGVDGGINFLPNANRLFGNNLMRPHTLYRVVASGHFSDDSVVIVGVKPSAIADLAAGFGVEGSVVENHLTGFTRLELSRALITLNDGQRFAALRARLAIAFEVGLWELLVGGIRRLLGCAFPGGASAVALFSHGTVKAGLIKS